MFTFETVRLSRPLGNPKQRVKECKQLEISSGEKRNLGGGREHTKAELQDLAWASLAPENAR